MPLPFVLAAVALGSAAAGGGGAGVVGARRSGQAKEIDAAARRAVSDAKRLYTRSQRQQERSALALGERKIEVMNGQMARLQEALSLFRHLDIELADGGTEVLEQRIDPALFESIDFDEWRRVAHLTVSGAALLGKAAGTGAATSAATMALGVGGAAASTGTPISGLSGAAATNATLAWFGGGSLATGGMGVAGGTAMLGGIAVAPVVLAGGLAVLHSGSKALDQARTNERQAATVAAQARAARAVLDAVRSRTEQCDRILVRLASALDALVPVVRAAAEREPDARNLTAPERDAVLAAFRTGEVIAELVGLRIVWRGRLTKNSARVLGRAERFLVHSDG